MRSIVPGFVLVTALALATSSSAQSAPPETLTLADIANRPERWAPAVKLGRDFDFGSGTRAGTGQSVQVLEFNGANVVVDAGNGLVFEIAPGDCNLLEASNAAWKTLTPAQRAIDAALLKKDASLWPERTKCSAGFLLDGGGELAPDLEYDFLSFGDDGVKLYATEQRTVLYAELAQTDAIARARERALVEPAKRSARIVAALKGALVGPDGKAAAPANLESAEYFVLYYGASWCGPCRKFSPRLVEFMKANAANPKLFAVLMSNDEEDADMLEYMKEEKMPWPALPLSKLQSTPTLLGYTIGSIPNLVVVDRHGMVLASSVRSGSYVGPDSALDALKKLLAAR
jgi:nucleoredoxin